MLILLDWLLLTTAGYLVAFNIGVIASAEAHPLPWLWWGAAALAAGLINRTALRRSRPLFWLLAFNIPPLAAVLYFTGLWQSAGGHWLPAALPGLILMALFWPLAAYLYCLPALENSFPGLWEAGLVLTVLAGIWGEAVKVETTSLLPFYMCFLILGLVRMALGQILSSRPAPGKNNWTMLPAALAVGGGALVIGMIVFPSFLGRLVDRVLSAFWLGLLWLGSVLDRLFGAGLAEQPRNNGTWAILRKYLAEQQPPAGDVLNAPVWLMVLLKIILAIELLFVIALIISMAYGVIQKLRQVRIGLPQATRRNMPRHESIAAIFFKALGHWWQKLAAAIRRCWRFLHLSQPGDTASLYFYFLDWSRRQHRSRSLHETPNEHLARLVINQTSDHQENKGLEMAASILTEAYTKEIYGEMKQQMSSEELSGIFGILRRGRLPDHNNQPGVKSS